MTVYLYAKQHRVTGLRYFGKTTRDPYSYNGSGKYWTNHCNKHGWDIETTWVYPYEDIKLCEEEALFFSKVYNIVESSEWANLTIETGLDGRAGQKGEKRPPLSDEAKIKKSIAMKEYWANGGHQMPKGHKRPEHSALMKIKMKGICRDNLKGKSRPEHSAIMIGENNPFYGKKHSEETREKIKQSWVRRKQLKEQQDAGY
jgi:hypothetical protein